MCGERIRTNKTANAISWPLFESFFVRGLMRGGVGADTKCVGQHILLVVQGSVLALVVRQ